MESHYGPGFTSKEHGPGSVVVVEDGKVYGTVKIEEKVHLCDAIYGHKTGHTGLYYRIIDGVSNEQRCVLIYYSTFPQIANFVQISLAFWPLMAEKVCL